MRISDWSSDVCSSDLDELAETFEFLGDWEERYRYLIELGRKLAPLSEEEHDEAHKVRGCMSQVWLAHDVRPGPPKTLHLRGAYDAHIDKELGRASGREREGQAV